MGASASQFITLRLRPQLVELMATLRANGSRIRQTIAIAPFNFTWFILSPFALSVGLKLEELKTEVEGFLPHIPPKP